MGILLSCPKCSYKNSETAIECKGKFRYGEKKGEPCTVKNIQAERDLEYYIEYRLFGKKIREKVGSSKQEALYRLSEVRSESYSLKALSLAEKGGFMTLGELFDWFMQLKPVESMKSYPRYKTYINALKKHLGEKKRVREITLEDLDNYIHFRLNQESPNRLGNKISAKTVKEEMNLLRNIFNRAIEYQKIDKMPVHRIPNIKGEDNIRKRIFTSEELERMIDNAPTFMMRMIVMAQGTGMRQNEIVQLKWRWVDLDEGFVEIPAEITKTGESRVARLSVNVINMLKEIPRFSHTDNVFLSENNNPIPYFHTYCRKVFKETLKKADIKDAVFHDLRHDFVTKAKRNKNENYQIMLQVGHKTESMLKRYQLINKDDLMDFEMPDDAPIHRKTRTKKKLSYRTRASSRQ